MRRLTLWIVSTVAALVLLFSYHTSTGAAGTSQTAALSPTTPGTSSSSGTSSGSGGSSSSGGSGGSSSGSGSSGSTSGTFTGSTVDTRWGPVQVQVTVDSGKITDSYAMISTAIPPGTTLLGISIKNGVATVDLSREFRAELKRRDITVAGGKITDVQAVVYPQDNPRDQEINAYALPVLHDEVIDAQSAQIDAVSGATVTSDGYITSLQAAIDAANLKS